MECKDCLFLFDDYIDEKLGKEEASEISKHLATCSSCALAYQDFRQQQEVFERYFHNVEASPLLWKKIQNDAVRPLKTKTWWQGLFESSISIPAPVFATVLILIAAAFISANVIWKRNAAVSESALKPAASITDAEAQQQQPKFIEKTKIVEVPVIKERVITRVVYVERQKPELLKTIKPVLASARPEQAGGKAIKDNITVSGITADKGYFTQVDLSEFQPTNETKVRVIREVKDSDK